MIADWISTTTTSRSERPSTRAYRLIGVTLHGTTTLITRDAAGNVVSQQTQSYAKSWGLGGVKGGNLNHDVISADFTDLTLA